MNGTYENIDRMILISRYPDKYFDLVIDDPPYGIGEDGSKNHTRGLLAKPKNYKGYSGNDNNPPPKEYFKELFRVSKNQIIFGANHFIENLPKQNSSSWVVWDKDNGGTDFADCELAWTSFNSAVRKFKYRWNGMLQENMKNKEIRIHPNQKPVDLYKWILNEYTKHGQIILNPHAGSGSLEIACEDIGLQYVSGEHDIYYFNRSLKRIKYHLKQEKLFQVIGRDEIRLEQPSMFA